MQGVVRLGCSGELGYLDKWLHRGSRQPAHMLHLCKVMVKESFDALNIIYIDLDGFFYLVCVLVGPLRR